MGVPWLVLFMNVCVCVRLLFEGVTLWVRLLLFVLVGYMGTRPR